MTDPSLPVTPRPWRLRFAYVMCVVVLAPASVLVIVPVTAWGGFGRWITAVVVSLILLPITIALHRRVFPADRE